MKKSKFDQDYENRSDRESLKNDIRASKEAAKNQERINALLTKCNNVLAFDYEGIIYLGNQLTAIQQFVDSTTYPADFHVWLQQNGKDYPALVSGDPVADHYRTRSIPKTLIISGTAEENPFHNGNSVIYKLSLFGQTPEHPVSVFITNVHIEVSGYDAMQDHCRNVFAKYFKTDLFNIVSLENISMI